MYRVAAAHIAWLSATQDYVFVTAVQTDLLKNEQGSAFVMLFAVLPALTRNTNHAFPLIPAAACGKPDGVQGHQAKARRRALLLGTLLRG